MIEILFTILSLLAIFFINKFRLNIASFANLIDRPDQTRKFHKSDTPLLGGLMIFIPFLLCFFYSNVLQELDNLNFILAISGCCFVIGLIDDIKNVAYRYKFIFLISVFYLFLYLDPNLQIDKLYFSTLDRTYSLNSFGIHFTVLCLLLFTNALNLIDGVDGLCILVSIILFAWIVLFFKIFEFTNLLIILSLIYIFFLNIKKKIFLGDSGSLFIGSLIGLILINSYNFTGPVSFIPVESIFIALMLPGFDMLRVFSIRIYNLRNPFIGDRNHMHHLLVDNKVSNQNLLIIYLIIITIPLSLDYFKILEPLFIIIFYIIFYLLFIYFLKIRLKNKNF